MNKHKDPFDRPADRVLLRVRLLCAEYDISDAYRLLPGEGDEPDGWHSVCPMHPDAGHTLLIIDRGDEEPWLNCSVGCSASIVRYALDLDPERNEAAEVAARVLMWAQRLRERRQADARRAA